MKFDVRPGECTFCQAHVMVAQSDQTLRRSGCAGFDLLSICFDCASQAAGGLQASEDLRVKKDRAVVDKIKNMKPSGAS